MTDQLTALRQQALGCMDYQRGVGDVDDWRRSFDRLAALKRQAAGELLISDRAKLSIMMAELAVMHANCRAETGRDLLRKTMAFAAIFAGDNARFESDGSLARD